MDVERYQELSGNTSLEDGKVTAAIRKSQLILENLLGFTLDPSKIDTNYWDSDVTPEKAFRIFPYNKLDLKHRIDPANEIHSVRFLKTDGTTNDLEDDDFFVKSNAGVIQYVGIRDAFVDGYVFPNLRCGCDWECPHLQMVVDADWVWDENKIPEDLLMVWADMVTYYADDNRDIRSQTLGSHSYTKFDKKPAETDTHNMSIIQKYAGPNGDAYPNLII